MLSSLTNVAMITGIEAKAGSAFNAPKTAQPSIPGTAGIGENAAPVRAAICAKLGWLGARLDEAANLRNGPRISTDNSTVSVFVIPTNEELMIAQHTLAISKAQGFIQ